MYTSTILSLFLAALAAAAPSPIEQRRAPKLVTFVMTEPDCPSIEYYCKHCNDDFNCETDPRCEWCYQHDKFGSN
ncbi:hypothetical protein SAMD00023353_1002750 [Rosellinia necatrix]|uniref:Uncharacterized protein n=1 Tax=Rosellinia necatrix TaxID=77044 RepID=A0A1S8A6Y1_ROSNE|nr:hypothetical protein SAMD00023353_1002750 [Rosellinia necatrix]